MTITNYKDLFPSIKDLQKFFAATPLSQDQHETYVVQCTENPDEDWIAVEQTNSASPLGCKVTSRCITILVPLSDENAISVPLSDAVPVILG
ncbi:hypothetical protein DPMN_160594 [Dreissena polymorpha]|uniref:Uncharacterized protein n=1 Tax=Dreissena polymorpha TaxID=45954 RepID=A0A9D4IQA0_DREPO|nr:hypothetical protein DPMN_160594 [Dreissena polymorpha]